MTYIIAEIGSVHDGSFGNARELVRVAAECGADAVKFQTHIPESETLPDAPAPSYFQEEDRASYFARTAFSLQQLKKLRAEAEGLGMEFLSSPFSIEAVHVLEEVGVPRYKIPSGEITNLPLLDEAAGTGKPILLSSGMSTWSELEEALDTVRAHDVDVTVLQCTSAYPCSPEQVGLNVLEELKTRFDVCVGLSDHTMGGFASIAAVALGATVIERHLTFSRRMYGSDARHSLEPDEFKRIVREICDLEVAMANPVDKDVLASSPELQKMKDTFEKSIVLKTSLKAGDIISEEDVDVLKPGTGLPPRLLRNVVGSPVRRDLTGPHILQREDVQWNTSESSQHEHTES